MIIFRWENYTNENIITVTKESSLFNSSYTVKSIEANYSSETSWNLVSVIDSTSDIIFINNFSGAKAKYTYFNLVQGSNDYVDNKCEINEQTFFKFSYPYLIMIKGSLEVIVYSFINNIFYYEKLNCPILCGITNAVDNYDAWNSAYILFDAGPFLIPCSLTPQRSTGGLSF